ncbi:MAG: carboxylating nicotinate-nucleotide diphosphorylase [Nitrososphaeraceae archaeon]|jgi:nicotinate-nucleotide pyrophosphorylase (carboxylating)
MCGLAEYLERRNSIVRFLEEDIGSGDITSSSIVPSNKIISAVILCNDLNETITCGLHDAQIVFDVCNCWANPLMNDGSNVKKGDVVMQIRGEARSVLKAERTALNLIMRMSGIATLTRRFVNLVEGYNPKVRIAGTRKTAPGLRAFDKKAIATGGGYPHRMRLDEMVMIKDNHLAVTDSIEFSIRTARTNIGSAVRIECEVRNTEEAIRAAKAGANVIMLDNFTPSEAESCAKAIREFGTFDDIEIELSGGITLSNVVDYVKAQPDLISVGQLTHSPTAVDYSLEIVKTFDRQEL